METPYSVTRQRKAHQSLADKELDKAYDFFLKA